MNKTVEHQGSFYRLTKQPVLPTMTVEDIVKKVAEASGKKIGVGLDHEDLVPMHGNVFPFQGLLKKKTAKLF